MLCASNVVDQDCLTVDHCGACLDLLPNLDDLNLSRQDISLFLAYALVVDVVPPLPIVYVSQTPPVSFQKHLHMSVPTSVLQI